MVILAWLVMALPLRAEIQDVRKEIAEQSERHRAIHFADGHMPPKHDWRSQRPLGRPEALPEFLTRHNLAWVFEEQRQDLDGLLRQPNRHPVPRELASPEIKLKKAEADRVFGG